MGTFANIRLIMSGLAHMRAFLEHVQDATGCNLSNEFDKLSVDYVLRNCRCRDAVDILILFAVWRARVANECDYDLGGFDDDGDVC